MKEVICHVSPDDFGVPSNDLSQAGLDRCAVRMTRFLSILALIYGQEHVERLGGFDENYICQIRCCSAPRSSYAIYRHLMAYAEYYLLLGYGDYPILASLLSRLARDYMTEQMLLEEEERIAA